MLTPSMKIILGLPWNLSFIVSEREEPYRLLESTGVPLLFDEGFGAKVKKALNPWHALQG